MPVGIEDFVDVVQQLPDVARRDNARYSSFGVQHATFAFLWPTTRTVGLKQLVAEQLALVAERPEAFEIQYTSGPFGWVVVHLERIDRAELAELTFEAWRLTAPAPLVQERADRLPR